MPKEVGVFKLAPGESARRQLELNAIKGTAINYWYLTLAVFASLAVLLYLVFRILKLAFSRRPA